MNPSTGRISYCGVVFHVMCVRCCYCCCLQMFAKFVPTLLLCVGGVGIVIIAFAPRFVQLIVLPVVAWYLFQSPVSSLSDGLIDGWIVMVVCLVVLADGSSHVCLACVYWYSCCRHCIVQLRVLSSSSHTTSITYRRCHCNTCRVVVCELCTCGEWRTVAHAMNE